MWLVWQIGHAYKKASEERRTYLQKDLGEEKDREEVDGDTVSSGLCRLRATGKGRTSFSVQDSCGKHWCQCEA